MGLFGQDFVVYQNLLSIDFAGLDSPQQASAQKVSFKYSLYESLVTDLLQNVYRGGIDVDSNRDGKCEVALVDVAGVRKLVIYAGKSIRFSDNLGCYQFDLNLVALPFLATWITTLLLQAVSLPTPPNNSSS
jgi:hypothetical protein